MKEIPILFSAPMVHALLAGTKTQTRRVVKDRHIDAAPPACFFQWLRERCPYGQPGDRLWVRETWGFNPDFPRDFARICFRADPGHEYDGIKWVPSIHMPRRASRITLEVTDVRVERLQDISEADALAEGVYTDPACPAYDAYADLWDQINGAGSWAANPWVWAVSFRRITP